MLEEFPLKQVHTLVAPGPVLLLTTSDGGRDNVMALAWHMMLEFTPPRIGCCIAPQNYSLRVLRKTKECVLAIPGWDLLDKTIGVGNCSGAEADKFARFRLHRESAAEVQAPLIQECLYNIECRVIDTTLRGRYDLFVLEGVRAWRNPARREKRVFHVAGDGKYAVQGRVIERKA